MLRALSTAATGMRAQELKMNVTANNLANANTTGFKRARAEFEDLMVERRRPAGTPTARGGEAPSPMEVGLGVRVGSTTRSFGQGDLIGTDNPLDVAIQGPGFFRVVQPSGALAYTRAGNFRVDAAGRLATQQGLVVDPAIDVPATATDITVLPDGRVQARVEGRAEPLDLGVLELAMFTNPGGLHAMGNNLFEATGASGLPLAVEPGVDGAGSLAQGFLEGANVRTVDEMIGLITTQRTYEMNSKVISAADQMLQRVGQLR